MAFNEGKTRIVSLDEGCDFLGFTVRRQSGKLLIKPSKAALRRHRQRLRSEMRSLRGHNAVEVLQRLTPIVRGWATYYRTVVSSEMFSALDRYLWKLTYKWAKQAHPKKVEALDRQPVLRQVQHAPGNDRWVFGDRNSGAYLVKHAWTRIVRHQMVKAGSSPDDPALAEYWASRRRKRPPPPMDNLSLRLLQAADGVHVRCAGSFSSPPTTHRNPRTNGSSGCAPPARRWPNGHSTCQERGSSDARHHSSRPHPLPPAAPHRRGGSGTSTTATPAGHWACLSRMRGNVHVRLYVQRVVMLRMALARCVFPGEGVI